ncbi:MAG: hypothetical protein HC853_14925 [Anaerolineae bacterium]|nr:hypothetical protein [Anaerolineae bacterium]
MTIDDIIIMLRSRVAPTTVLAALSAAGGITLVWIALTSVRRVSLKDEAARVHGLQEPSLWQRAQMRLNQSGLPVTLPELLLYGGLIGIPLGVVMILAGFAATGVLMMPIGFMIYIQYVLRRRAQLIIAFREQLPEAIDDVVEYYKAYQNLPQVVKLLATQGPAALRPLFGEVEGNLVRKRGLAESLAEAGRFASRTALQTVYGCAGPARTNRHATLRGDAATHRQSTTRAN